MGLSNSHFEFLFPDRSPMRSSTLQTNPFLSLLTLIILATGQWFLETLLWYTTKISSILKFLLLPPHFWRSCKDWRYSFFQRDQNSLAMCWIRRQRSLLYISGLENSPGGGETAFDFMVRMFTGDKDLLDHWELLQSAAWNSKCLVLLSLQSTKTHHLGTCHVSSIVNPEWLLLSKSVTPKLHPCDLPKESFWAI